MNKVLIAQDEVRLKRLRFRSGHRGCKETDLVLGAFGETQLHLLDAPALDLYEQLLEEDDADIWDWLVGKSAPPEPYQALIAQLKASPLA